MNLICFATCIEGLFFFAGFRLCLLPAFKGPSQRFGRGHQLGVP